MKVYSQEDVIREGYKLIDSGHLKWVKYEDIKIIQSHIYKKHKEKLKTIFKIAERICPQDRGSNDYINAGLIINCSGNAIKEIKDEIKNC